MTIQWFAHVHHEYTVVIVYEMAKIQLSNFFSTVYCQAKRVPQTKPPFSCTVIQACEGDSLSFC